MSWVTESPSTPAGDKILLVRLNGTYESRDGYWVAKIPSLGTFAYADTLDEAQDRAMRAVDVLVHHWSKYGVAERRLRAAGIQFEVGGEWTQSRPLPPLDPPESFIGRPVAAGV